jgi:hypothetical protein
MKIHIFYRHYNIEKTDNKGRPSWFDYEKCFKNLLESLEDQWSNSLKNVVLHVMFDGNINNNFISKYKEHYISHEFYGGSDSLSFFETISHVKNQNLKNDDLIYFLENDYLHTKGWANKVIELFSTYSNLNYISLYDHNDKYFLPMYEDLVSKIFTTKTHHWRTTPSTCGSFIIRKDIFDQDYDILSTMEGDHNKFLWLNQNRNRFVITPIPGLSTHCMGGLLSPTIDWEKINN